MSDLRRERFCIAFVEGANAAAAARSAGYEPRSSRFTGYRLLRDPRVIGRIADLRSEAARHHGRSTDSLIGKLETIFRAAFEDHQYAVAARAVEVQGRLAGITTLGARKGPASPPAAANDNDPSAADESGPA
jgi:phage terminase small subunit